MSVPCNLVITCWKRANLLAILCVMFPCVSVTFPLGVSGQPWYLIVLITNFCLLCSLDIMDWYFDFMAWPFAVIGWSLVVVRWSLFVMQLSLYVMGWYLFSWVGLLLSWVGLLMS